MVLGMINVAFCCAEACDVMPQFLSHNTLQQQQQHQELQESRRTSH